MVINSNDREFDCNSTTILPPIFEPSVFSLDATVLDVNAVRDDLERMSRALATSVDEYKRWLESRESEFELRFLANDFSRDIALFNRLNGVVSRVRQARKRLNGWYSHMQELLANGIDQLGTYSESVAVIRSYGQSDLTAFGGGGGGSGIAFFSPLAQAKRNVSKIRNTQRHLNTLAVTESRLKTTLINLRTQMEAFSRGVVRNDGKLLDLAEVGKMVNELMGGETPLLRVQQQLANTINATKTSVRVTETTKPLTMTPPFASSFLDNLNSGSGGGSGGGGNENEADHLLQRLRRMSEITLYTDSTKEIVESIARLAQTRINDRDTDRRAQLDTLLARIRANVPSVVINYYGKKTRQTENVFLRLQRINDIIDNLQPADRDLYEKPLREIYWETHEEAKRTVEESSSSSSSPMSIDDDDSSRHTVIDMDYESVLESSSPLSVTPRPSTSDV